METFTPPRPFSPHPQYRQDRERSLRNLEREIQKGAIDAPLLPLIRECILIPHCFTVQCCYGHFVHELAPDLENLTPISRFPVPAGTIRYRIAYLAICLEDSPAGHFIFADLEEMAGKNPALIQFGSADWFWDQIPNTYCIQLEPERMKDVDSGPVSRDEALQIEGLREPFFAGIAHIVRRHRASSG